MTKNQKCKIAVNDHHLNVEEINRLSKALTRTSTIFAGVSTDAKECTQTEQLTPKTVSLLGKRVTCSKYGYSISC